jgi:hypothetical protein
MRFFEFSGKENMDKVIVVLRNYIGRQAGAKAPIRLNWNALNQILTRTGAGVAADYETFKSLYDNNPVIQSLVRDFNQDGIELNVPGTEPEATQDGQTSQEKVDQIAASAAPQQLAQQ